MFNSTCLEEKYVTEELTPQYSDIIFYSSQEGNICVEVFFGIGCGGQDLFFDVAVIFRCI